MSEPDNRTATVRPLEELEATGRVAEIFTDIKRTKNIDFVPRFWQVIATNPVQLDLVWTSLKSLMHPEAVGRVARLPLLPCSSRICGALSLSVPSTNQAPMSCPSRVRSRWSSIDPQAM